MIQQLKYLLNILNLNIFIAAGVHNILVYYFSNLRHKNEVGILKHRGYCKKGLVKEA